MIGYIIVLALGAVVLVVLGRNILQGRKSQGWPTAPGTILYTGIETHQSTDEDGSTSTTYGVTVQYSYEVGGQTYQGDRRTFTNVRTGSRNRAMQILERYPQGGAVSVYYDPDNPASSVLETGVGYGAYALLIFAIVMVVFGLIGLLGFIG